ncbi:GTPase [candidate division WOR-3 bacterium JGI_Cruoil_03_51_56]|uniref:GTPase n=1 Tax=candidate division WOR-3 bacterium JGI_Cruoil_03_51_56 TaxID=1973747 RepID=A0A235BXH3_UNCW3|nr:MAG: GTPase [candidate division WOR-3 bacterium JGI_Cruoil_03_51_56]
MPKKRVRIVIVGAAGMDYHVFNTCFRNREEYEVVAFTMAAEQNLGTVGEIRTYPPLLAGYLYPNGIPTYPESELDKLIRRLEADEVVFAYSDAPYNYVMGKAAIALAAGANFRLFSPRFIQLQSKKPVVAVCAVRTGCGKSQTSRRIYEILVKKGLRVVAVREPMPYGDLKKEVWQRFARYEDLDKAKTTIEEREEYEPYIENNMIVYAGADYAEILKQAEKEADVIIWDGGNNEVSFFRPDYLIVLTDPLRPGHGKNYHPGEVNLRQADVVVINKEDSATKEQIAKVKETVRSVNAHAVIVDADSPLSVADPDVIKGRRVLVIEDGPTVTHGGMPYGAGRIAAERFGAAEIIDPKPYAQGSLAKELELNSHLEQVLPAMGYNEKQLAELKQAIEKAKCDIVVSGTPIDLARLIKTDKPIVRVKYYLQEKSKPDLESLITDRLAKLGVSMKTAY